MHALKKNVGVLDRSFLSRSVGLLNPAPPLTLAEEASVGEALEVLRNHKVGCVVVVDKAEKVAGIFSERDAVLKLFDNKVSLDKTKITEVMTPEPKTIEATAPMALAINLMCAGGYRHMPIVDDELYPVGIISIKDLMDYIAATVASDLIAVPEE